MIYQHPLAYLLRLEGLALLRSWAGDFDREFVERRLAELRRLLATDALAGHLVISDAHHELVIRARFRTRSGRTTSPARWRATATPPETSSGPRSRPACKCDAARSRAQPRRSGRQPPPPPEELAVSGCHQWPWSRLDLVAEATSAAWAIPPVIIWHFGRARPT